MNLHIAAVQFVLKHFIKLCVFPWSCLAMGSGTATKFFLPQIQSIHSLILRFFQSQKNNRQGCAQWFFFLPDIQFPKATEIWFYFQTLNRGINDHFFIKVSFHSLLSICILLPIRVPALIFDFEETTARFLDNSFKNFIKFFWAKTKNHK